MTLQLIFHERLLVLISIRHWILLLQSFRLCDKTVTIFKILCPFFKNMKIWTSDQKMILLIFLCENDNSNYDHYL